MDRIHLPIEVKFAGSASEGTFSGYGAVFGNRDSYGDVIDKGAFKSTLREWEEKGKLPPMLLQHGGGIFGGGADDMLPVGKWTAMEENARGLKVEGQLFALGTSAGNTSTKASRPAPSTGCRSVTGRASGPPAPRRASRAARCTRSSSSS